MDPVISQILNEPARLTSMDAVEMAVAAGGRVQIAGHDMPAPAAAVIAMLGAIESPFVVSGQEVTNMDVFRALYLVAERDKVAPGILRWKRREEALERLKKHLKEAQADGPHAALIVAEQLRSIADAKAEYDAAALRYGEKLGAFDVSAAANELGYYLSLAGGFEMLPDPENPQKKTP